MVEEILQKITGNPEIKIQTTVVYPEKEEKLIYAKSSSEVDVFDKIENRLVRIEEKLDKLLEVLSVKSEKP